MEEILPPQTEHGAGFERTRLPQFTVFLVNRVGRLTALLRALEESVGRIIALSIEESADSALVRLICSEPDASRAVLGEAGFPFGESDLLAVELPKKTKQPLIAICSALLTAEINIHYAYPLLLRPRGPSLALYVDDPTLAARRPVIGHIQPLTYLRTRIEAYFAAAGYEILDGPETEDDYHNYEALNQPADHPARDMQDTLYLEKPWTRAVFPVGADRTGAARGEAAGVARAASLVRTVTSAWQCRDMERLEAAGRVLCRGRG